MADWRNRIVGYGEENADQLLANESNWRIHPKFQQDALSGLLNEIGWIQNVIVNKRTAEEWGKDRYIETLVDGHLRASLAITRNEKVPITYVDLTPDEERLALSTIDPIAAMAVTDKDQLDALLKDVNTGEAVVQQMLSQLAADNGITPPDFQPVDIGEQSRLDERQSIICPNCGHEFKKD